MDRSLSHPAWGCNVRRLMLVPRLRLQLAVAHDHVLVARHWSRFPSSRAKNASVSTSSGSIQGRNVRGKPMEPPAGNLQRSRVVRHERDRLGGPRKLCRPHTPTRRQRFAPFSRRLPAQFRRQLARVLDFRSAASPFCRRAQSSQPGGQTPHWAALRVASGHWAQPLLGCTPLPLSTYGLHVLHAASVREIRLGA